MSTSLLRRCDAIGIPADRLCRLIEDNAEALRAAQRGRSVVLDGVRFRVLQSDRNTVFRVGDGERWYLKMPRNGSGEAIEREILGCEAIRHCLAGVPEYEHPRDCRASATMGYILTSELAGTPASHVLYRSILLPFRSRQPGVEDTFFNLGAVLARLHRFRGPSEIQTTRPLEDTVLGTIHRATRADELCTRVEHFATAVSMDFTEDSFVHGNSGLRNILARHRRVSLIDFECCGRGSIYDDLSLVCGHLVYSTRAVHLPNASLWRVLSALLQGYRAESSFDAHVLANAIALRVGQSYAYWFCSGRERPTLAGLPISRKRVRRLLDRLLGGDALEALRRLSRGQAAI